MMCPGDHGGRGVLPQVVREASEDTRLNDRQEPAVWRSGAAVLHRGTSKSKAFRREKTWSDQGTESRPGGWSR